MLSIILNDNELDLFEDSEIVWQWTAFRFQTVLRDAYSNNFSIPKTNHNIQVLGVYSILDQSDIQFEGRLQPAVMNLNGTIMPIYIQVCSINDKEIEICIYEDKLIYTIKGSKLENVKDSPENFYNIDTGVFTPKSIFEWNRYSSEINPDIFKYYNYGATYNPYFANIHPSIKLNDILDKIGEQHNVNIQHFSDLWRVICTKRTVCPENKTQVLEFNTRGALEDNTFTVFGGQHVTNDTDFSGMTEITFNRHTEVDIDIWYCWNRKNTTTNSYKVWVVKNDDDIAEIVLNSSAYHSDYGNRFIQATFEAGDKLKFQCWHGNKYKNISFVVKMTHNNYDITEDDYGEELLYKGRRPRLQSYSDTNDDYTYIEFNGSYNHLQTESLSFSYFGLWCNIPKLTVGELLYSLQYIMNARCIQREDTIFFDQFVDRNSEVAGEMTSLKFHSSSVGKNNYLRWKDGKEQSPIVTFDNEWLQNEKVWSQNCFKWIKNDRVVPQYTMEINEDAEMDLNNPEAYLNELIKYNYDDFDEPVLLFFLPPHNQPATMHTFGLERINNCKEVSFTLTDFPPEITDLDTIYVDGREYYIIEGEKNFKTGQTTIKALLLT